MSDDIEMEDQSPAAPAQGKYRTPPYIAYQTALTVLGELKAHGVPPRIDRSLFPKFAGGVQGQILLAMRSLDLIDEKNVPKPRLQELVDAYETDRFKPVMRQVIQDTYPYVFALDLMQATPSMFADAFKNACDAKEDVLRKCRTFFLKAAKDLEIPIGARITNHSFPRTRANGQRKPARSARQPNDQPPPPPPPTGGDAGSGRPAADSVLAQLLTKFPNFDPEWPPEIQMKWFEGFDQFMKKSSGG